LLAQRDGIAPKRQAVVSRVAASFSAFAVLFRQVRSDQRGARYDRALVYLRHALEGRSDEGGRRARAPPPRGYVAWTRTRQTNGFLEAINGLFQAAKRRARGFTRLSTIKTVIFLIAGKLDFHAINPHARQPT
jgi:hypothetical protein